MTHHPVRHPAANPGVGARNPTCRPSIRRLATCLLAVLGAAGCSPERRSAELACEHCNVILISIDTLRADHLSAYGYHRPTSPTLDRLAADGVLFEDFVNNGGTTLPSHMSMMTSLHPAVHGVTSPNPRPLAPRHVTLAELLRQAGLTTAAFVDKGWMEGRFGFVQGFDLYDDPGGRFATILPKARQWLERNRDRRFFLFLHTYDVHSEWERLPYDCPGDFPTLYTQGYDGDFDGCGEPGCASQLLAAWNREIQAGRATARELLSRRDLDYLEALYDGCINYVDARLGAFLEDLRDLGLYDRSLIVVTSDHGEEFAEHGLFLHSQCCFEELAHIPLVMKLPYSALGGKRVRQLAAMVDLMPTVLEILGAEVPGALQGRSLVPLIQRDQPVRRSALIATALRTERWKYYGDRQLLHDLEMDPQESTNVIERHPSLVEPLGQRLASELTGNEELRLRLAGDPLDSQEPVRLSAEEIRHLQALGYLDP